MHKLAMMLGRSALVVKEVMVDESAEMQVKIVGRKAGLISWLLSLLGIDSTFTLCVYSDRLESREGSLSGMLKTMIPLSSIDTYTTGFAKPFICLVFGIAFLVMTIFGWITTGSFAGGFVFLIFAVVTFIMYALQKCLVLNFTTNGGNGICFLFKRSVIEGVNVDESFAERVGEIVKQNYVAQTRK